MHIFLTPSQWQQITDGFTLESPLVDRYLLLMTDDQASPSLSDREFNFLATFFQNEIHQYAFIRFADHYHRLLPHQLHLLHFLKLDPSVVSELLSPWIAYLSADRSAKTYSNSLPMREYRIMTFLRQLFPVEIQQHAQDTSKNIVYLTQDQLNRLHPDIDNSINFIIVLVDDTNEMRALTEDQFSVFNLLFSKQCYPECRALAHRLQPLNPASLTFELATEIQTLETRATERSMGDGLLPISRRHMTSAFFQVNKDPKLKPHEPDTAAYEGDEHWSVLADTGCSSTRP